MAEIQNAETHFLNLYPQNPFKNAHISASDRLRLQNQLYKVLGHLIVE